MKVIFVGDSPSKKNLDPNIPFVGTKSHKTLLSWTKIMSIAEPDIILVNQDKLDYDYVNGNIEYNAKIVTNLNDAVVIALGNNAKSKLEELYLYDFFHMPHPSGLNRKLNDKKYLKNKLVDCKTFLLKNGYDL